MDNQSDPSNHKPHLGHDDQATKPHIVFVPGAGHGPIHYELLFNILQSKGFEIDCRPLLMNVHPDPSVVTILLEADAIRDDVLLPIVDASGEDVLLVVHSWGANPGGAAAVGLSKKERIKQGNSGGIIGVVAICGVFQPPGSTAVDAFGGKMADWMKHDVEKGVVLVPDPIPLFYHDVEPTLAKKASSSLLPSSYNAHIAPAAKSSVLMIPLGSPNEDPYQGKRLFIRTEQDRCVPPAVQDVILGLMGGTTEAGQKNGWKVKGIDTSHSPFLSEPAKLADVLAEAAREFAAPI